MLSSDKVQPKIEDYANIEAYCELPLRPSASLREKPLRLRGDRLGEIELIVPIVEKDIACKIRGVTGEMKIAISGNGFGGMSFAQMLEVVRSVGVNFIELVLGINLKGKDELHEILDQLYKYNIAVACVSVTGRFSNGNIKMHQQFICEGIGIAAE